MKRVLVPMGAVLMAAALALPALAAAPQRDQVSQNQIVQGPTSCGLLRWEIHLTGDRFRFFDDDGQLVRVQVHINEDNTITNVDTGETYREGPDNFMQTTLFTEDGPLIVATGLAANVPGAQLKDVGRVVIDPSPATSSSRRASIRSARRRRRATSSRASASSSTSSAANGARALGSRPVARTQDSCANPHQSRS